MYSGIGSPHNLSSTILCISVKFLFLFLARLLTMLHERQCLLLKLKSGLAQYLHTTLMMMMCNRTIYLNMTIKIIRKYDHTIMHRMTHTHQVLSYSVFVMHLFSLLNMESTSEHSPDRFVVLCQ